jgi:2-desacetyl-2-hydroxyethyl bacteriochlorophyllide A dehydrogenase
MRARAVVFSAPGKVEFREVDCPDPGPDDVVVRLEHSWISNGTETSLLLGERIAGDTARGADDPEPFPVVPGYQGVGRVEGVGKGVTDVAVDDAVFVTVGSVEGMFWPGGGHVSPAVVKRSELWKLPTGQDPLAYAGLVLAQVGYNCGAKAPLGVGDPAVVIGDGLVGHWAAQTLAWRGGDVVLVGRHADRLGRFGLGPRRRVLDATVDPPRSWLDGAFPDGVAVVVDTAGSIEALEDLTPCLRRGGHIVSAGFYGTDDQLSLQPLREDEITVHLVSGWEPRRMDATLDLVTSGDLETLPLVTHHFPAARAAEAWKMILERTEPLLGVVLDWS